MGISRRGRKREQEEQVKRVELEVAWVEKVTVEKTPQNVL